MKAARIVACVALFFLGGSAFVGAIPMIVDPAGRTIGMPLSLLDQTPFHSFLLPGIILLVCNGLLSLAITVPVLRNSRSSGSLVIFQGCVIFGWITVQVFMIRTLHWLHFLYWGVGIVLIVCGWVLRRHQMTGTPNEVHAS